MLKVLVAISPKFCCRKEALGYAKFIVKKMDKCLRYLKQLVLRYPPKKERDE